MPCALILVSRWMIYAAFAVLALTGMGWLIADQCKDMVNSKLWQGVAAALLMLHGGGAMPTLLLLRALVPLHVQRAWRGGKNRATGATMVALNVLLVVTAFGRRIRCCPGRGSAICTSLSGRFCRRYLSSTCCSAGEWLDAVSRVEAYATGSAPRERSTLRPLRSATVAVIFEFSTFKLNATGIWTIFMYDRCVLFR